MKTSQLSSQDHILLTSLCSCCRPASHDLSIRHEESSRPRGNWSFYPGSVRSSGAAIPNLACEHMLMKTQTCHDTKDDHRGVLRYPRHTAPETPKQPPSHHLQTTDSMDSVIDTPNYRRHLFRWLVYLRNCIPRGSSLRLAPGFGLHGSSGCVMASPY